MIGLPRTARFVVFAAAWVAGALGATTAQAQTPGPLGGAFVTTLPSGADVFFDGTYLGRSPLVVDGVAPGRHGMTITKAGYASLETSVTVQPGMLATSSTRLGEAARGVAATERGTLVVRGLAPGATLRVDGAAAASVREPLSLGAGPHRLEVDGPQGRTIRDVTIYPNTPTDVIVAEVRPAERRSGVVAPAEDYLPTDAFAVERTRIVVRYLGHVVVAHFGDSRVRFDGANLTFDSAPEAIGGKLYLPLALLEKVTGDVSNGR